MCILSVCSATISETVCRKKKTIKKLSDGDYSVRRPVNYLSLCLFSKKEVSQIHVRNRQSLIFLPVRMANPVYLISKHRKSTIAELLVSESQ